MKKVMIMKNNLQLTLGNEAGSVRSELKVLNTCQENIQASEIKERGVSKIKLTGWHEID
jgi:hypothetical protein